MRSRILFPLFLVALFAAACGSSESVTEPPPTTGAPTQPVTLATVMAASVTAEVATEVATIPPPLVATNTREPETAEPSGDSAAAATATPQPTPTPLPVPINSVRLEPFVPGGLTRPLFITHAHDARVFIVEQPGLVRIVEAGQLLDTPFLDIRDRVGSVDNEQGLLGLAFSPGYQDATSAGFGTFYVNYTDYSGNTVVSRFRVAANDPNRADKNSEVVVLQQRQPYSNHNGGQLLFGPDGYLYIALGDGGSAGDPENRAQDMNTWLGKMLRIDVSAGDGSYQIPADNPFVGQSGILGEIWAYGLRNPWRSSFDRLTGDMYIADVGQNLYEELNYVPTGSGGGVNYGWRIMEGMHCYLPADCSSDGLAVPFFEYDHANGCSITGGYVYRGAAAPQMAGNYFAADYCLGTIWRFVPTAAGTWDAAMILDSDLVISSFGEDYNGELYVTDHAGGAIYRLLAGD